MIIMIMNKTLNSTIENNKRIDKNTVLYWFLKKMKENGKVDLEK